ncbi:eukaryotic translation initiation factor 4E binding protein-like protein [Dinothrombium tinctorium]|uniref:Eukaryotic translation initiation factor 4E binding protein-like protein n=1 Tax=Dinothrombium tinctorium TaxID=1965070 RepID=A0A443RNS3_9ACAR|nr:eukaryotic translation initiation factor 4E binding protein-like protein [Dinothrombium tinctorium]
MSSPKNAKNSCNQKGSRLIPTAARRVYVNDVSQLGADYSSTPGGTLFSTTPGGTRIIYDRGFLLQMRNSPLTKTPPKNLPYIPGVTNKAVDEGKENKLPQSAVLETINESTVTNAVNNSQKGPKVGNLNGENGDEPQFSIEM